MLMSLATTSIHSVTRAISQGTTVPPSVMQRIEGEWCLQTNAGDLETCMGAGDQVSGKHTRGRLSLLPL
jgi:hypothetical protein